MNQPSLQQQLSRLWSFVDGATALHLVNIGLRLGLFARVASAVNGIAAADLARELGLQERPVDIWCRTAYHYGLLEADDQGCYRLGPHYGSLLADPNSALHQKAVIEFYAELLPQDYQRYPEYFQTSQPYPTHEHGFHFSRNIAEQTRPMHWLFVNTMLPKLPELVAKLQTGVDVLDVGCGSGGLMLALARAFPTSRFLGIDIDPYGIAAAQESIDSAGLAERVRAVLGSVDTLLATKRFDLAVMFLMLHELAEDAKADVLAGCYRALKPGGQLLIVDETYPQGVDGLRDERYRMAVHLQWTEMLWGSRVLTASEQDHLLAQAGFVNVHRVSVRGSIANTILAEKLDL